jgi:hypothetical protein
MTMIPVLKVSALYFASVFAAGFLLGTIRTLWIVPMLGARAAELIESPIMLVVVAFAARTIVRRHAELSRGRHWLTVGFVALAVLLVVEFTVVLRLRDLSLSEYFATRDPVSGTVYYVLLGVFAVMPFLMFSQQVPSMRRARSVAALAIVVALVAGIATWIRFGPTAADGTYVSSRLGYHATALELKRGSFRLWTETHTFGGAFKGPISGRFSVAGDLVTFTEVPPDFRFKLVTYRGERYLLYPIEWDEWVKTGVLVPGEVLSPVPEDGEQAFSKNRMDRPRRNAP